MNIPVYPIYIKKYMLITNMLRFIRDYNNS